MNLKLKKTKLVPIGNVEIPEIFSRRFMSGIEKMDVLFGGSATPGVLPGSSFCISATPGCGKSTLMLQWMEALTKVGYKCAIVSGEEAVEQMAFNAKRLGVTNIEVANMNDIDQIAALMKNYDVVLIDSFQAMHCDPKKHKNMSKRREEEYKVELLCSEGKKQECVVGFVLHVTKSGNAKGGMVIFHSVDAIFEMEAPDDTSIRWISTSKNRFGPPSKFSASLEPTGFDFSIDAVETLAEENKRMGGAPGAKGNRGARREAEIKLLTETGSAKGILTLKDAAEVIGDMQRARFLMSDLHLQGVFKKEGRGQDATFTYISIPTATSEQEQKVTNPSSEVQS